jgi:hypothetical protein
MNKTSQTRRTQTPALPGNIRTSPQIRVEELERKCEAEDEEVGCEHSLLDIRACCTHHLITTVAMGQGQSKSARPANMPVGSKKGKGIKKGGDILRGVQGKLGCV